MSKLTQQNLHGISEKALTKKFTFCSHVYVVGSSCFNHIRDLRSIRRYLDLNIAQLLATALVSSRLDYCNSLLSGIASSNFNVFRINWPVLWQCHHHLLVVLHCCAPFIGYPWNLELISRSICWPTWLYVRNKLFIFTRCLPHCSKPGHWEHIKESVRWSLGSRPAREGFSLLCPFPLE